MDAGSGGLQSGFVLAAIVAAILFAERFGGTEQLARRIFQLALATSIVFAVIAGTTAFIRPPSYPANASGSSPFSSSSDSGSSAESKEQQAFLRKVTDRDAAATSVHFALGVLGVVIGSALLRRWRTGSLAIAVGGLLLVLFGGIRCGNGNGSNPIEALFSSYFSAIGAVVGTASRRTDIIRFALFTAGAVVLLGFGLWRWDTSADSDAPAAHAAPAA